MATCRITHPTADERHRNLLRRGMVALVGSLAANLLCLALADVVLQVPSEFRPLRAVPVVIATTIAVLTAVAVYAVVRHLSATPNRTFRWLAAVALAISAIPTLSLLSSDDNATPKGVVVLLIMHVMAAIITVWALTGGRHRVG